MKNSIVLLTLFLMTGEIHAQSKFGLDENACKENLSLFREYYKQKNYEDALKPWRWTFLNCPESSGNIYKNGPKIIKAKMKLDKQNRLAYIDTLMMIFDQRIQYGFGNQGYILGLKGYELLFADNSRSQEAFDILNQAIGLSGNKSDFRAIYGYMKAVVDLEKESKKTKEDVLAVYSQISAIVDYNILNESKVTKYFVQYSEKIENLFTPYANCDDLVDLFSSKFNIETNDVNLLRRITKVLEQKECTDEELFFIASNILHKLEPSSLSAYNMSKMSILKGNNEDAVFFAKQAVEMEEDDKIKAKYYLALADSYRASGSYSLARKAVYNSLEIRPSWGEAYMSLGNIYIAGAQNCGNEFEQKTVYWVAVDAFKIAVADPETKTRASKSINTYSKYFPSKEICFFNGIDAGSMHKVECWVNKETVVRTID